MNVRENWMEVLKHFSFSRSLYLSVFLWICYHFYVYIPKSNSFTSDAALSPSARNALSMFFDRSIASLSLDALTAQPILMRSYFFFSLYMYVCWWFWIFFCFHVTLLFFILSYIIKSFRCCIVSADIDSVLLEFSIFFCCFSFLLLLFCYQFGLKPLTHTH